MVEIVERFAVGVSRIQWEGFLVGCIEFVMIPSEEFGEREVGFTVSKVATGIENESVSIAFECGVARPEVAVENRGLGSVVFEGVWEGLEEMFGAF